MEYYLAIKKNQILPFVITWVDLEGILLSEISQREKEKIPYNFTYMWNLKNKRNKQNSDKPIGTHCQLSEERGLGGLVLNSEKVFELGEKGEGVKYKLVVTEKS